MVIVEKSFPRGGVATNKAATETKPQQVITFSKTHLISHTAELNKVVLLDFWRSTEKNKKNQSKNPNFIYRR